VKTSSKSSVKVLAKKAAPKVAAKAKTVSKAAASASGKAKPAAKAVKASAQPVKTLKPAVKKPSASAAKLPVKAAVKSKTVVKAPSQPAPKPVSKPVSKPGTPSAASKLKSPPAVVKPIGKLTGKAAVKAVAKPVTKLAAKPTPKPTPKSPAQVLKAVAIARKAPVQTAAPAAVKASSPSHPKEVLKSVKAIAKAPIAPAPEKVKSPAKAVASKPAPAAVAPVVAVVPPGDVPARATRPSARLAQITVPSMAQSVASTAAKASYLHHTPTPVMIPVFTAPVKKDAKLANNWKTKKIDQLTDAEILAMSDDDYMNDTQKAYFRRKLVLLKEDMLANAGQTTENLREDTVVVPDPADRATIEEEHALELRTRDRERKLLKKIEQSINHIDAGDYGYCDETGEPIGVGRLLARPTATLSLEAQQRRELKQKMFGD